MFIFIHKTFLKTHNCSVLIGFGIDSESDLPQCLTIIPATIKINEMIERTANIISEIDH